MEKIDFVLTWVDGSDPDWLAQRREYQPGRGTDAGESRYRDWDNLQYWFRGVEKFAPWVNKIYFVTWGHVPKWLNTAHEKIQIVKHEDFMAPAYLPTFNINSIELNLHRIKGLSEHFVFFNDDMFLIDSVKPEDFFKNGLPCDCCIETALVQDNIRKLEHYGYEMIEPVRGMLANGDTGDGKLPSEEELAEYVLRELAAPKDMAGLKILVTAGPTQEAIDPVRYITNHSTGKMGYAIARRAMYRGADVTLVTGPTACEPPRFVNVVPVVTAAQMYDAVMSRAKEQDIIVKAAAVADYRPASVAEEKIKKSDREASIELERTQDILAALGADKGKTILCGFSMETEHMLENSRKKLRKKNVDLIAANNLKVEGAGFGTDTNVLTLITEDGERELARMSKEEAADELLTELLIISKGRAKGQ